MDELTRRPIGLLKRIWRRMVESAAQSNRVQDEALIAEFVAVESNTFLVSFPRTGSHWLRMLIELYFERPSLVRTFYYPDRDDFLLLHTHDLELELQRSHVIYLYRDPVDTVYSQLRYGREKFDDRERIEHWAALYGEHLNKWLIDESFSKVKTLISYEAISQKPSGTFALITGHFDQSLDEERFLAVYKQVSKEEVRRKTGHDKQVMQASKQYAQQRTAFKIAHGQLVWDAVLRGRPYLTAFFQ